MDNRTKSKYLGVLLQTVLKVDDAMFGQRVSPEKHDYADWIAKNIKDEELASQLRPFIQKDAIVKFLQEKIAELSQDAAAAQPTLRPAPENPTATVQIKQMDGKIKAKYLGVLVQTILKMDEATFRIRVSPEKHDYADWIAKNIKDEELAEELRSIRHRQSVLEFLADKIAELGGEAPNIPMPSTPAIALKTAQAMQPPERTDEPIHDLMPTTMQSHEETKPKQEQEIDYLRDINEDLHFVLPNGKTIGSLPELAELMPAMDDAHFSAHVTPHKNDFAAWIYHSIKDEELANSIGNVKDKQQIMELIKARITELAGKSIVTDSLEAMKKQGAQAPAPQKKDEKKEEREKEEKNHTKPAEKPAVERPYLAAKPKEEKIDLMNLSAIEILKKLGLIRDNTQFLALEEEISEIRKQRKTIATGVPGFDDMIGGGIPVNSTILVSGGPGSGKTTFCIQMLGWAAEQGEKCLFLTFEETEEQLIEHMEAYGLNPKKYLEKGTLMIQRQDPFKISRMVEALLAHARGELLINIDEIIDILPRGYKPDRIVVDSLSAISAAFSESNTAYRVYVTKLMSLLQKTGATSFLISEVQGIENIGHGLVEEFLADGVIVFYNLQKGNIKQSALEVLKMRAVDHEKRIVPFEFVKGRGLVVYPLERTFM
ncbi:MAG: DUF5752 family protein [archaeon]